jgi:hypothetical protein
MYAMRAARGTAAKRSKGGSVSAQRKVSPCFVPTNLVRTLRQRRSCLTHPPAQH